ncbi:uncharacterized protein LOC127104603 [Lathyrus oleraceus]|uniref:uncharacterized protein LOC127104603 n=1 Tax=Pisum sativum TaxID=3888 RepID=UPI0021D256B7|nr:uncharacterized protein LOC127104603 [Pisum sativum]
MTKRGGKAKVLAPGKLQEERNRIINKKHIVRKPAQTTLSMQDASSAPTPAQAAPSVQVASSMPTSASKKSSVQAASSMPTPAQEASSVQVASSMPASASKKSCVQAASLMPTPAQAASSVQAASSMPTPAQAASSVQAASSMPTPAQAASSVQAASSMPTPAPTVVPVHATTSEKFSFMPTPTLSHQTMAGPQSINLQTMASPSNLAEEEDVDADEDEAVGQETITPLVPTIDENGKVIIKPSGTGLVPAKEVAGAINYAIRKQFYKPIHHWSALDPDTKADWFKLFGEKVSWDPFDHAFVYSAFEKKGRKRLNDMLGKARRKGTRPSWIGDDAWVELQTYWKKTEFLAVSSQNKTNRASARGGAVHTTGRKAHIDVALQLSRELQRDLRPDELFLKTHKRKNGEWVDSRAASTYVSSRKFYCINICIHAFRSRLIQIKLSKKDLVIHFYSLIPNTNSPNTNKYLLQQKTFKEKFDAELQPTEEGNGEVVQVLDGERVNQLWTEAAGGRNRGRVYGAADLAINLKRGSKSFTQQSQTPQHSMFGMSLEAERAARIRAEQIAEAATTQLQEANEAMRAATEAAKAATETAQRMEREMNAWKEFMMKKFDTSTFVSHSHHYDDDLDDQSLDED